MLNSVHSRSKEDGSKYWILKCFWRLNKKDFLVGSSVG